MIIKLPRSLSYSLRLSLAMSAVLCAAVAIGVNAQTLPQSVTKDRGVVSIDPVQFVDGRLVLRVVAFNKSEAPATLTSEQVRIATSKGAEVNIVPLQKLIDDAKANAHGSSN